MLQQFADPLMVGCSAVELGIAQSDASVANQAPPLGALDRAAVENALWTVRKDATNPLCNDGQRAPSARPRFVDVSRQCAQTSRALLEKRARFFGRIR